MNTAVLPPAFALDMQSPTTEIPARRRTVLAGMLDEGRRKWRLHHALCRVARVEGDRRAIAEHQDGMARWAGWIAETKRMQLEMRAQS